MRISATVKLADEHSSDLARGEPLLDHQRACARTLGTPIASRPPLFRADGSQRVRAELRLSANFTVALICCKPNNKKKSWINKRKNSFNTYFRHKSFIQKKKTCGNELHVSKNLFFEHKSTVLRFQNWFHLLLENTIFFGTCDSNPNFIKFNPKLLPC